MYYCDKCHYLSNENECHICGFKELREVKNDDFCFLITVEETLGRSIIECLKNEDIDCAVVPVGDGVRSQFALTLGNYQLYVPYIRFDEAVKIVEFFTENYSLDKLRETILKNRDKWHFENEKTEKRIRKKLKLSNEIDLMEYIKEKVEQAQTINDAGLMTNNEHGLVVKSGNVVLWFSSISFKINI